MRRFLLLALLAALAAAPAARAWTWPTDGQVLQPFSFDPASPYAAGQHRGIDLAGSPGDGVRAPKAGVVSFAGTVPGSGRSVTIETADGWSVTLTHLGTISVKKDAVVAEGDPVAAVGDPGVGEAPFVQLGIRKTTDPQGYVDPLGLLPPRVAAPAAPAPDPQPAAPAAPAPAAAAPAPVIDSPVAPVVPPPVAPAAAPVPAAEPVAAALPPPLPVAPPPVAEHVPAPVQAAPIPAPSPVLQMPASQPALPVTHDPSRPPDAVERVVAVASRPMRPAMPEAPPRMSMRPALPRPVTSPVAVPEESHASARAHRPPMLELLAALLATLAAVLAVLSRRAGSVRPARMMDHSALLLDNTDLLREQHAAHRPCLHDLRGRHPRSASKAARGRNLLPHGRRRARDEGLSRRPGARDVAAGLRRLDRRELARPRAAPERPPGLLHPHER